MSTVKIAAFGSKTLGSSSVPTLIIIEPGRAGLRVPIAVPQVGQNARVTGRSRSERENSDGEPLVYRKFSCENTMIAFGYPPVMYWHSRQ